MKQNLMKLAAAVALFASIVLGVNENPTTWWTILIAIPLALISLILIAKTQKGIKK